MPRLTLAAGVLVVGLAACGGTSKPGPVTDGSGTGAPAGAGCERVAPAATALYQVEGKATGAIEKDATFVEDNVAMVVADCAKDPGRVAPCVAAAKDVAQLEKDCLVPLDEEGSEGEKIGR